MNLPFPVQTAARDDAFAIGGIRDGEDPSFHRGITPNQIRVITDNPLGDPLETEDLRRAI